jgi:23S rRNA U2552 (ribose-2'-O)-methylase RlmE/FtsJ
MDKSFIIEFNLDNYNYDNIDTDDFKTSSNICLPLCSLGFQNYLVRTKNYLNVTKNFDTELYYVVNPFEINISNYNENIIYLTKNYLNDITESEIDFTFYKMWEILHLFDILNKNESIIAVFSNNSNGILQAIINYKKYFKLDSSKDKIFNISDEEVLVSSKIIKNHKGKHDITSLNTIISFKKEFDKSKKKANLIIADCGYETYTTLEPEMYNIIISEIIIALKVQEKDGHFILKVFETFTMPTVKLIYFVSSFYKSFYIYKPYYSRPILSEKYIIFKNYKYEQNTQNNKIKNLEDILIKLKESNSNLYDIWSNLKLSEDYVNKIKYSNFKIANIQQIMINDIINYIKENNYFGAKYHMFKEKQINSTKWWIDTFMLCKSEFNIKKNIEMFEAEFNNFSSSLTKVLD